MAIAQWLGSVTDPDGHEREMIAALDTGTGSVPQLVRYAFFSSAGWFDGLAADGWISQNLTTDLSQRTNSIFWWLSNLAAQRPTEIAAILDRWWTNNPDRGNKLLDWFGFTRGLKPNGALFDLCCNVIRSKPTGLFQGSPLNRLTSLLHTWAQDDPSGVPDILKCFFSAWFDVYPGENPFGHDQFQNFDEHSLSQIAKKMPEAFVEGTIDAFVRSVELVVKKQAEGHHDSTFSHRAYSGHHFGPDAFVQMFRSALKNIASTGPYIARTFLRRMDPDKHEVMTHLWLETISANAKELSDLFTTALGSPFAFEAGWDGADWKSLADSSKAVLPFLNQSDIVIFEKAILAFHPELDRASNLTSRLNSENEDEKKFISRASVIWCLNNSGLEQWSILESIGEALLTKSLRDTLSQLRRKFSKASVSQPHHHEAHWVQSPIEKDRVALMTDDQWLSAIARYDSDDEHRYQGTSISGGAYQLSNELQQVTKQQTTRFAKLLERIPDSANQAYIRHILYGLAEADDLDDKVMCDAISNAHRRPSKPYGSEIVGLFEKHPRIAADPVTFDVLLWYVQHGEQPETEDIDTANAKRELVTIDDLIGAGERIHIRGINGARGRAAEALGAVLWQVKEAVEKSLDVLEQQISKEPLVSVRCCLMRPLVPLFISDRLRSSGLVEQVSRAPSGLAAKPSFLEKAWIALSFASDRLPNTFREAGAALALAVARLSLRSRNAECGARQWWLPLGTHQGVYLLPFLVGAVPAIGERLIYRLLATDDEIARLIGSWHVFNLSFRNAKYAPLAEVLFKQGVAYRRLAAHVAASAVVHDEYRFRAQSMLETCFNDDDDKVRRQAAEVFRNIEPKEFYRFKNLADSYLNSRAFEKHAFAFFHSLEEAECRVDDLVIAATEKIVRNIELNPSASAPSTDLHQLDDLIKREYAASENDPALRGRLLDLIDKMLTLEVYGVDNILKAHER